MIKYILLFALGMIATYLIGSFLAFDMNWVSGHTNTNEVGRVFVVAGGIIAIILDKMR